MKNLLGAITLTLAVCLFAVPAHSSPVKASDIHDFVVHISKEVAAFLNEAGAEEIAVIPYKNALDNDDYALSDVLTIQLLQDLRYNQKGYTVVKPGESARAYRVTGVWETSGDEISVITRIVKMPSGEVDITLTGTIPVKRVPEVYIAKDPPKTVAPKKDSGVRVAIMNFQGYEKYPRIDYLARSIPETVTTVFARQSDLLLVERLQRDKIMSELRLAESEYTDPDAVVELGKLLGANYMIIGSYQLRGKRVRLMARRVKVDTGEIFEASSVLGTEDELFELEDALANELLADIQRYR